jgi:hypothetical protein
MGGLLLAIASAAGTGASAPAVRREAAAALSEFRRTHEQVRACESG